MFKGHPKGLYVAFFANMGERFGFYTMMAILVIFLQAKFDLTEATAGEIYSWFYFSIYAMALIGGLLADLSKKYKTIILIGQVIMFAGYALLAVPNLTLTVTMIGLFTIAFGNGLFKGNLQAVVGQLYDDPKYSSLRNPAYMLFYMGINVGGFFAPFAANGICNWWLQSNGFLHDGSLPSSCHQFLKKSLPLADQPAFHELANKVSLNGPVKDLAHFSQSYLDVFSRGYNYAFAIASVAMIISLVIYLIFSKLLPNKEKTSKDVNTFVEKKPRAIVFALAAAGLTTFLIFLVKDLPTGLSFGLFVGFVIWIILISTKEEKPRTVSLVLVFIVAIFFWMSFHQNGLTLTFFARDYTVKTVAPFTYMFFTLENLLSVIGVIAGIILIVGKKRSLNIRLIGGALIIVGISAYWYLFHKTSAQNPISPEIFQVFNPLFIVSLTFVVMAFFAWLNKKGIEPSPPRKIGIGMIIAAIGFMVVLVASLNIVSPHDLQFFDPVSHKIKYHPVPDSYRVMPYWLMSSYLVLTIAELFLSPMGLSFVSKVAPPRFQGLMQGGWLLATAAGNKLLFIGSD